METLNYLTENEVWQVDVPWFIPQLSDGLSSCLLPPSPPTLLSTVASYPYTCYPGPTLAAAHALRPLDLKEMKGCPRQALLRHFFRQEAKVFPEASLADFPLRLIGQDCRGASPSRKGGWKLRPAKENETITVGPNFTLLPGKEEGS